MRARQEMGGERQRRSELSNAFTVRACPMSRTKLTQARTHISSCTHWHTLNLADRICEASSVTSSVRREPRAKLDWHSATSSEERDSKSCDSSDRTTYDSKD